MPAASSDDRHTSPPLLLRRLGGELRRLREEVGLTTDQVVSGLYCSPSKISRLETGRVRASFRDVRDILDLYRVPEQQRASLYQLADEARQRDRWWHSRGDVQYHAPGAALPRRNSRGHERVVHDPRLPSRGRSGRDLR